MICRVIMPLNTPKDPPATEREQVGRLPEGRLEEVTQFPADVDSWEDAISWDLLKNLECQHVPTLDSSNYVPQMSKT